PSRISVLFTSMCIAKSGAAKSDVVRTSRFARRGRPKGLHYIWLLVLAALVSTQPQAQAVQQPEPPALIQLARTVERELRGGQQHVYQLALTTGEYASVTIEQRGIDVVVDVSDANGKSVAEFDADSRSWGREAVGLVAAATGQFQLTVK